MIRTTARSGLAGMTLFCPTGEAVGPSSSGNTITSAGVAGDPPEWTGSSTLNTSSRASGRGASGKESDDAGSDVSGLSARYDARCLTKGPDRGRPGAWKNPGNVKPRGGDTLPGTRWLARFLGSGAAVAAGAERARFAALVGESSTPSVTRGGTCSWRGLCALAGRDGSLIPAVCFSG